jgi:hypothetical protein
MIVLLNTHVHTITITDCELQFKLPIGIPLHDIESWIKHTMVYEWYRESDLGKHLVHIRDPEDHQIDYAKQVSPETYDMEHRIYISAWLSQEQIDKIELAFFINLRRHGRYKYGYE